ncbi:MAG: hypothetical protein JRE65_06460 [Deltaproteobacteria bacterium]|nr:hypothetical protein [Deltaproteobacteria bacterium]
MAFYEQSKEQGEREKKKEQRSEVRSQRAESKGEEATLTADKRTETGEKGGGFAVGGWTKDEERWTREGKSSKVIGFAENHQSSIQKQSTPPISSRRRGTEGKREKFICQQGLIF